MNASVVCFCDFGFITLSILYSLYEKNLYTLKILILIVSISTLIYIASATHAEDDGLHSRW